MSPLNRTFAFFIVTSALLTLRGSSESRKSLGNAPDWSFLVLAQLWPPGTCHSPEKQGCYIPNNMTSWSIHGLWPSITASKYPQFCNDSWHFKPDVLANITSELEIRWGNMKPNKSFYSLWKHEWQKHGTCAATDPRLGNEYLYFSKGLFFYYQFNVEKILDQFGITANSTKTYPSTFIRNVLIKNIGKNVTLECTHAKGVKPALVSGVSVCIDSNFSAMDCFDDFSDCSSDVLLLPFNNKKNY